MVEVGETAETLGGAGHDSLSHMTGVGVGGGVQSILVDVVKFSNPYFQL